MKSLTLTTTLLLTLLVLGSCTTGGLLYHGYILDSSDEVLLSRIIDESSVPVVNDNFEIPEDFIFIRFNLLNNENSFLEAYVSPRRFEMQQGYLGGVYGTWIVSAMRINRACERYSGDVCLLDEFNGYKTNEFSGENYMKESLAYICSEGYYFMVNLRDEVLSTPRCQHVIKEEKKKQRLALRLTLEKKKQEEEQMKLAVIHALKDRCVSYGFTGSNNIAACVQREAQHDYEIEQKEYELKLALQTLQNQSQTEEGIPWWGLILGGIAEGAAEGYKQSQIIKSLDSRYERKDIYRYCRPNC